jgi:hypothetical protein
VHVKAEADGSLSIASRRGREPRRPQPSRLSNSTPLHPRRVWSSTPGELPDRPRPAFPPSPPLGLLAVPGALRRHTGGCALPPARNRRRARLPIWAPGRPGSGLGAVLVLLGALLAVRLGHVRDPFPPSVLPGCGNRRALPRLLQFGSGTGCRGQAGRSSIVDPGACGGRFPSWGSSWSSSSGCSPSWRNHRRGRIAAAPADAGHGSCVRPRPSGGRDHYPRNHLGPFQGSLRRKAANDPHFRALLEQDLATWHDPYGDAGYGPL